METAPKASARAALRLFEVRADGVAELPIPPAARTLHELFDELSAGVYSALRTFDHVRFLGLEQHFDRTDRSAELLGWSERLDRPALRRALDAGARAYPERDACVRFDLVAAVAGAHARTLLAFGPLATVPEAFLREGVSVSIAPLRRVRPLIKTARFVLERRPYPLGRQDAYEHLIVDAEDRILEGTSSNFLALRGSRLHLTGDEALQGVTQGIVARLAAQLGLECVREPIRRSELGGIEEAFVTGSTRGLVPVVAVEGQRVGAGVPGPRTLRLMAAYREHAARDARSALEEA